MVTVRWASGFKDTLRKGATRLVLKARENIFTVMRLRRMESSPVAVWLRAVDFTLGDLGR